MNYLDRTVYLNGEFLLARDAKLSVFDRGLLFADAVYEGLGLVDGKITDFDMHMSRLDRSLGELGIQLPINHQEIKAVLMQLARLNGLNDAFLYFHVTRGEADRSYSYAGDLKPNVFALIQPCDPDDRKIQHRGASMHTYRDLRWKRRDIKSTNLLGQVMAKQAANEAGTYEALLVDDEGYITEAASRSFFIVRDNTIFARPVTPDILHGITRQAMLKVADANNLQTSLQRFTLDEALSADEAFLTGSSTGIEPVIEIDTQPIGDGKPGPIALLLREEYLKLARRR